MLEKTDHIDAYAKLRERQNTTPPRTQARAANATIDDEDHVVAVGCGQACGPDGSSRAALAAVEDLDFDLQQLQREGTLHILVEAALGRPFDEILSGVRLIWDAVGGPCAYEIDFDFFEGLDDEVIISLIVCRR
ncbi:hypothetical protein FIV42_15370 [Persicimonas caeni]|uniref:Uncharacterized protein n=1 Tax=Persicimonas caeni TaxID=2292766 RepID=A0A4Y6PUS3_PERCE|nr:hypothetical protein [Persicimonas caeni]QDG52072.1 hypothetical protein FIV42_15370 [Persicimonas caeni]QED33293.1 hypothetical protein FRD00_15365 [Persicimonas caeni]